MVKVCIHLLALALSFYERKKVAALYKNSDFSIIRLVKIQFYMQVQIRSNLNQWYEHRYINPRLQDQALTGSYQPDYLSSTLFIFLNLILLVRLASIIT